MDFRNRGNQMKRPREVKLTSGLELNINLGVWIRGLDCSYATMLMAISQDAARLEYGALARLLRDTAVKAALMEKRA
jgi:hypothetical protein